MGKIFGRTLSLLVTFAMVFSVLLVMPVSTYAAYSLPVDVEAEDCTLGNGAVVTTNVYGTQYPGYSGDGFVWVANSGTITLEVTIPENGMYELSTRCWMYLGKEDETRMQVISINGKSHSNYFIPNKGQWIDYSFGFFYLEAGKATIEIGSSGSWGFILYDKIYFDHADMPDHIIDPTPCDPNATPETRALMKYLTSVYGKYVISGQQEIYGNGNDGNYELEFDYIYEKTGKYPAIRGFDFMNYNPLYGWEDGTTARIIDWVKNRGGIATACWHINIPRDFASYKLGEPVDWTNCTYKPTSSFNTANCLDETTKEHAYLMMAIEDLAEQLLILQEQNIPILFRPFHEAEGYNNTDGSGAWFWWGSAGAEVYKELWKLLYKTLTEKYGIHNLIWEVNLYTYANSYEWYPGDEYVDIIGYDKYEGSPNTWGTSAASSLFLTLVNYTNDTKMVALTENDVIPDIQNIVNEEAWWLYFCPWYGDFLMSPRYNDPVLLNTIYNSEYVITLDELPENLYEYDGEIPDINYGDLNNDGNINSTDYMILKKYILKVLERMNVPEKAADLNGDGSINSTDLTILKRFIMKAITKFPVTQK
ncbi:MAG TPA: glycoside hydrolase [Hungateiclostridium thermocellum]|jgi:mannan endo-1,4-beta-mannosidase|uniref:Dockerin type 1 n=2 Tax=Acetivibrio thermocellus TaxID=1515 RepID=A3DBE4_ACET2|nr:glycosyl hydrolase [Acetivibrio thermocellus]CDG34714.1 glycoside hydrolase family protein [Acetivibrio thermocellus BC1]ABN51273.1 Dockerin type 1 [Acetivibrio thermocellus ATCC 27405]ADU75242.1 Dockerin type 1 [Acetivibrio thermocellus DSM 1313]ALX09217.1 Mannan endo-1,4-beta-mannosidase, Cellulase [Acetivibrio thermocellus AD2]ANV76969.1 Mannan endo-1,4-beta-mannosidase, Cellulase [Acetivibrio thermocellus DSM 2360]